MTVGVEEAPACLVPGCTAGTDERYLCSLVDKIVSTDPEKPIVQESDFRKIYEILTPAGIPNRVPNKTSVFIAYKDWLVYLTPHEKGAYYAVPVLGLKHCIDNLSHVVLNPDGDIILPFSCREDASLGSIASPNLVRRIELFGEVHLVAYRMKNPPDQRVQVKAADMAPHTDIPTPPYHA